MDLLSLKNVYHRHVSEAVDKLIRHMQTLGRVAIISGGIVVALINLYLFMGVENLPKEQVAEIYQQVYLLALTIPAVSVLGVITASILRLRAKRRFLSQGMTSAQVAALLDRPAEPTQPNWWILGGSLLFVLFTLTVGMADFPFNEETSSSRDRWPSCRS